MKRVLIIDDDCFENEEAIRAGFEATNVEIILCEDKDEGLKWIKSKALFDCIVLDWYLGKDSEDSFASRLILKELEKNYYAPVLIYSAHSENFRAERDENKFSYPPNLIHEVDKDGFNDVSTKVTEWLNNNITARLSNIYFEKVYEQIHKTFWNLNEIPHDNIASVYKHIIFEKGNIDWGSDFIINWLLQNLISDEGFRIEITRLIEQIQTEQHQTTTEQKQKILNKIIYFKSNSPYVSNSDIIKIQVGENISYGIVISPDCDLAQSKTKYIEFIELRELKEDLGNSKLREQIAKNNSDSHFYFLSLELEENSFTDLVAILKSKNRITCCNNDSEKYPCVINRIKYSESFQIDKTNCSVSYVCSLLSPYKAEFAHKKSAHDSRVGIPSVYKYFSTT